MKIIVFILLFLFLTYSSSFAEIFTISFYCPCIKCCGKNAKGITASGKKAKIGMIAVDKKLIKLGTKVKIKKLGNFTAEDTGSAIKGKRIDIFCENHKKALKMGIKKLDVIF